MMRFPWGGKKGQSAKQRKLKGRERRLLQEADEDAGRQSPPIPDDPPRRAGVKIERDYLKPLRSPLSRLDGSPPRGVNKETVLSLSHKRRQSAPTSGTVKPEAMNSALASDADWQRAGIETSVYVY
jgi:hypothetical protein